MFDRDMRCLAASRRWLSDHGLDDGVLGRSHDEVFPEIPERWKDLHRRALAAETIRQGEDCFERLDGSAQWLEWEAQPWRDESGEIGGLILFAQDITERKAAEAKLREAQRRLESVMAAVPVGVAYSDDRSCTNITGNPAFLKLNEMEAGDNASASAQESAAVGRKLRFFSGGVELSAADLPMQRVAAGAGAIEPTELEIELAGGRRFFAEVSAAPVRSEQGETIGAVAVVVDLSERKRAEAALRESEEFTRAIVEDSPDIVEVLDVGGRLLRINETGRRLMELDEEAEPCGKDWPSLWPEASRASVEAALGAAQAGCTARFTGFCPTRRGKPMWWDVIVKPLRGKGGKVERVLAVSRDITKMRTAEAALQRSENELAVDLEAMIRLQRLGALQVRDGELQPIFLEIVDAAMAICGADFGNIQIVDRDSSKLSIAAQRGFPDWWVDFWNAAERGGACHAAFEGGARIICEDIEHSAIFADTPGLETLRSVGVRAVQSTPLISRSGALVGVFSTHYREPQRPSDNALRLLDLLARHAADLIERMFAEEALRESEARFRTLTDMSPDAILVNVDGRYVYANAEAVRLLGARDAEELLALTPFDIAAEPYHDLVRERYRLALEENRADPITDYQWRRRDGSLIDVGVATGPTLWRGKPALQLSARDISFRKRAEAALCEADRRKEEFLAMLAHELRNPLAPIRNGLYVARKKLASSQDDLALIAMMERQVDHLVRLVDDLIDISRINRGKIELQKERVPLDAILRQAVETVQPHIEARGHQMTVELPTAPIVLDADPVRLAQVFANLLHNATKYSLSGGSILLRAERAGDEAKISVRDEGFGIAPDLLSGVFELFTQAHRANGARGGLGVGLAIVRSLVDLHGGGVEAFSEGEGQGAEFVVRLPLAASNSSAADDICSTAPSQSLRVMVVDDDRDVADSLLMLLGCCGVEARVAYGGAEALASLPEFLPHLVFLDIGMPGMDGFETARRIRLAPRGKSLVLAALSGWGRDDDRCKTMQAGFDHHLVKPIDLASLESLLASMPADAVVD